MSEQKINKGCDKMCADCKARGKCTRTKEIITEDGVVFRQPNLKELFGFDKQTKQQKKALDLYNYVERIVRTQFQDSSVVVNRMLALKIVDEVLEVIYEHWYDSNNGVYEEWKKIQDEIFKIEK